MGLERSHPHPADPMPIPIPQTVHQAENVVFDSTHYGTGSSKAEEDSPLDFLFAPPLKVSGPLLLLAGLLALLYARNRRSSKPETLDP